MESIIPLESAIYEVVEVKEKTRAKFFKSLRIGDRIQLEVKINRNQNLRGRIKPPYIVITNVKNKQYSLKSFNEINHYMKCFKLKKIGG